MLLKKNFIAKFRNYINNDLNTPRALAFLWDIAKSKKLDTKVYNVPKDIDEKIAELKLQSMDIKIDELTEEQKKYLSTWEMGTT